MTEREGDRVTLGITWPTKVQYSTIRADLAHTFAPGEDRDAAIDRMADDLASIVEREMNRILEKLRPERAPAPVPANVPIPRPPSDRRY